MQLVSLRADSHCGFSFLSCAEVVFLHATWQTGSRIISIGIYGSILTNHRMGKWTNQQRLVAFFFFPVTKWDQRSPVCSISDRLIWSHLPWNVLRSQVSSAIFSKLAEVVLVRSGTQHTLCMVDLLVIQQHENSFSYLFLHCKHLKALLTSNWFLQCPVQTWSDNTTHRHTYRELLVAISISAPFVTGHCVESCFSLAFEQLFPLREVRLSKD